MQSILETHLEARTPGLCLVTHEELRALLVIHAACVARGYTLHLWSPLEGVAELAFTADGVSKRAVAPDAKSPPAMLDAFTKLSGKSVLVLPDFQLVDLRLLPLVRKLKDTLWQIKGQQKCLITLGAEIKLPPELTKELWVIDFALPSRADLLPVLQGTAADIGQHLNGDTDALLDAASGLTLAEAEQAYAISTAETVLRGGVRRLDAAIVQREKVSTVKKGGILEIVSTTAALGDIGGLQVMKDWLLKRRAAFTREARAYGLPMPKGFLQVGISGCGKSLFAKATAAILGLPLLRIDVGKLFGGIVGASEANTRAALAMAEAMAPCVLWADEMEKGMAGSKSSGQTDGGTSARVINTILVWMQEKLAPVFVVATANDVSQLPPELLRKGRFDELWFVDLPDHAERWDIWKIHLARRNRKPENYDLDALSAATEGFTGAEIEAILADAMFNAFSEGEGQLIVGEGIVDAPINSPSINSSPAHSEVQTHHLLTAIAATVPLSKTMASEIERLRCWAAGRARRANAPTAITTRSSRALAA